MRPGISGQSSGFTGRMALVLVSALLGMSANRLGAVEPAPINPPLGPYVNLTDAHFVDSRSFSTNDRVVLTPYFYWYDVYTLAHLIDSDHTDALTDHPATTNDFSYRSVAWHKGELADMIDAGIDVAMPVYWGEPSQRIPNQPVTAQPWSYAGLPPLVKAREELVAEGKQPPRIGMFYDTSTLQFNNTGQRIDLTTPAGWRWFYESIRDYFSLIPPKHWAMVNGQPVIFLYSAAFAANHDQTCLDYLRTAFQRDFGGRTPYVVREISWNIKAEGVYAWGGALGLKNPGVASLGPGYDHSAVPGRDPLIVPRENGAFFTNNWDAFLRRPSKLVMIETWNEFHEGTDVANSREYGRQYIELNRRYVDLFKAGFTPPRPAGRYTDARLLAIDLGVTNREAGLIQFDHPDGVTAPTNYLGRACRYFAPTQYAGRYMYFKADDGFKWAETMNVQVVVDFFDAARGSLTLQFDGSDPSAPFQGAYSPAPETVALSGSKTWRTGVFTLNQARLLNLENGGADFRIECSVPGVGLRRVQMVRPGLRAEGYTPTQGAEVTLFAPPGAGYAIDASADLKTWSELARLTMRAAQTNYLDAGSIGQPLRFYRARPR
jgi:hypothetical protein